MHKHMYAIQLHTPSIFAYSWVCVSVYDNDYEDDDDDNDDDNDQNNGSIFSRTAVHYTGQHLQNQANK